MLEVEARAKGQVAGGGGSGYQRRSCWRWRLGVPQDKLLEGGVPKDMLLEVEAKGYPKDKLLDAEAKGYQRLRGTKGQVAGGGG